MAPAAGGPPKVLAVIAPAIDPVALAYHEIRSPLGLVAMAARAAADDCTDEATRARCEMIVRAAERMLRTASQVFHLNRASTAAPAAYRPAAVVRDLVRDMRGLDVRIRVRIDHDAADCETDGVAEQFEALVHTLVTNAIDHGESGEDIRLCIHRRGDALVVTVTNRIAARRRHSGDGMGTYIAHELAQRLGAELSTTSRRDTFRAQVILPLVPPTR